MNKFLLGALLATTAHAAIAADLPSRKAPPMMPPPPPPPVTWTGFYLGANVGGGWLSDYAKFGPRGGWTGAGWVPGVIAVDSGTSNAGVVGGGQVGYNYQLSPLFVVGLEADIQASNVGDNAAPWTGTVRSVDWFGTVRARAGVSLFSPTLLFYGTGGFAYGDIRLKHAQGLGSLGQTGTGWTAGGGVEWAFAPNWSAKVEYLYTDIGAGNWGGFNTLEQRVHLNTVRVGVNYHFNLFAPPPAPVMAKY